MADMSTPLHMCTCTMLSAHSHQCSGVLPREHHDCDMCAIETLLADEMLLASLAVQQKVSISYIVSHASFHMMLSGLQVLQSLMSIWRTAPRTQGLRRCAPFMFAIHKHVKQGVRRYQSVRTSNIWWQITRTNAWELGEPGYVVQLPGCRSITLLPIHKPSPTPHVYQSRLQRASRGLFSLSLTMSLDSARASASPPAPSPAVLHKALGDVPPKLVVSSYSSMACFLFTHANKF